MSKEIPSEEARSVAFEENTKHHDTATRRRSTLEAEQAEADAALPLGFGILGRYPILSVVSFAIVVVGLGIGLSHWTPENPNSKAAALQWIGLIGDLLIRDQVRRVATGLCQCHY